MKSTLCGTSTSGMLCSVKYYVTITNIITLGAQGLGKLLGCLAKKRLEKKKSARESASKKLNMRKKRKHIRNNRNIFSIIPKF